MRKLGHTRNKARRHRMGFCASWANRITRSICNAIVLWFRRAVVRAEGSQFAIVLYLKLFNFTGHW